MVPEVELDKGETKEENNNENVFAAKRRKELGRVAKYFLPWEVQWRSRMGLR